MTGATNESAEEPCYLDRREVEGVPAPTPITADSTTAKVAPADMTELLAMFQAIDRAIRSEQSDGAAGTVPPPQAAIESCTHLQFIAVPLVATDPNSGSGDGGLDAELVLGRCDDVELFLGQLPFNFSHSALARGLQALAGSPIGIVTRMKAGPKPTCVFISVSKTAASRLIEFNKRVICGRDGMWVAPVTTGDQGLAEILVHVKQREVNHVVGLPAHPLVIEPVACKSKAGNKPSRLQDAPPHHSYQPPSYGQFVGDTIRWPWWLPPHLQMPFFAPCGGSASIGPFAAYPPPLMSLPQPGAMNCVAPFQAQTPPPRSWPSCTVAPHVKHSAKAYNHPRDPST